MGQLRIGFLFILFFVSVFVNASAQSLDNFYDDVWAVYWTYNSMDRSGNPDASNDPRVTPEKYSYSGISFAWRIDNTRQWGIHGDMQNRFIGDLIYALYKTLSDMDNSDKYLDRFGDNHLHNGYLGELNIGTNIIATNNFVFSSGLNLSDYFIENEADAIKYNDGDIRDGHTAYYFSVGGYAHMDFAFLNWLAARTTVVVSKAVTKKRVMNSRRLYDPLFISIQPELLTRYGFYVCLDYLNAIHDDSIKQTRIDIKVGIRF